jgi:hypothetical protein
MDYRSLREVIPALYCRPVHYVGGVTENFLFALDLQSPTVAVASEVSHRMHTVVSTMGTPAISASRLSPNQRIIRQASELRSPISDLRLGKNLSDFCVTSYILHFKQRETFSLCTFLGTQRAIELEQGGINHPKLAAKTRDNVFHGTCRQVTL